MIITSTKSTTKEEHYVPLPLGNGDLSMLCDYCGNTTAKEYFHNNIRSGIWRAGIRYEKRDTPLVSFGFFEQIPATEAPVVNWTQTLHLEDGSSESVTIHSDGVKIESRVYCLLDRNLVVIRKKISGTHPLRMRYFFAPERTRTVPLSATATAYKIDSYSDILGTVSFFSLSPYKAERTDTEIHLETAASEAVFCLAFDDEAERFALEHTEEQIHAHQQKLWSAFWNESTVPAERLPEKVRQMARTCEYHLRISSTRWSIPIGIYPTHWQGRYFAFDEYFALQGLLASGHTELAKKIPQFRLSHLPAARLRAYCYFGDGTEGYPARFVWEAVEEPGVEGAPGGFWLEHVFHMTHIGLGAWECSGHGRDSEFLSAVAYPLLRSCAEYFRIFVVDEKEKGRFIIGKCTDLERLGAACENPFMTTCGAIALFRAAAEAAGLRNENPDLRSEWLRLANALRDTLPQDERSYLPKPGSADKSIGLLSGIFPYDVLPGDDPKQLQAIEDFCATERKFGNMYPVGQSLCSWYAGWKALTFLRLGKKEIATQILRDAAADTGYFSEVFEIHETGHHPWFTTAEGALLQAVCEVYA